MSHELICSWLELPADSWPPDHYRLLGLKPGENDLALIERQVHLRLDEVRRYQMMHPEQATEVMNRLAQAFVCLTEPGAKRAYDDELLGARSPIPAPPNLATPTVTPPPLPSLLSAEHAAILPPPLAPAEPRDPFAWLGSPVANGPGGALPAPRPSPPAAVPLPVPEIPPVDPIRAAAQSPAARRGLGTRRKLYHRIAATRNLQRLWQRMGKYLDDAVRRFSTQDARELYRLVEQVETAADDFPLLGDLGQPGHYILNLGQLDRSRNLRNLTQGQRELLRNDWKSGLAFLEAHLEFLRDEISAFRRRGSFARFRYAMASLLREHPMTTMLFVGGVVALTIAVMRSQWLLLF